MLSKMVAVLFLLLFPDLLAAIGWCGSQQSLLA